MRNQGFSFVELLIVVALFAGLMIAISRIFFANLSGTQKTQNLIEVQQSGERALLIMKRKLRNAREITGSSCSVGGTVSDTLTIKDPPVSGSSEYTTTQFVCDNDGISTDGIKMAVTSYGGTNQPDNYLTSSNVTVSCGSLFTCTQPVGSPASININFSIAKGANSSDAQRYVQKDFSAKVTLRNY